MSHAHLCWGLHEEAQDCIKSTGRSPAPSLSLSPYIFPFGSCHLFLPLISLSQATFLHLLFPFLNSVCSPGYSNHFPTSSIPYPQDLQAMSSPLHRIRDLPSSLCVCVRTYVWLCASDLKDHMLVVDIESVSITSILSPCPILSFYIALITLWRYVIYLWHTIVSISPLKYKHHAIGLCSLL